jgi:tetratricopeptide (TPR) repeat protein
LLIEDLDRALAGLRRPELLHEQRRALDVLLAQPQPSDDDDDDDDDPERELDRISAARGESGLELEYAATLRRIGRADMARAVLEREARSSAAAKLELARALLAERDHAALDALLESAFDSSDSGLRLQFAWIYGESLRERGELERAVEFDRGELERSPRFTLLRLRLAANARALGDWADALAQLDIAVDELEPGNADWDRITAATVLGRWTTVRTAAARLGMHLPGEGDEPIELELGLIRCEFVEASGRRERYWARRSSPCGARIIEIAMPGDPQHFRDRVVFEPVDLEGHARERDDHRPCYEVVAIVEPGRYRSFLLRGFDPGAERFEALRTAVRDAGFGFERITAAGRSAADPRDEHAPAVATVALLVALHDSEDPARLRSLIATLTADWELPLLDPKLDVAAGEHEAGTRATALIERWKP